MHCICDLHYFLRVYNNKIVCEGCVCWCACVCVWVLWRVCMHLCVGGRMHARVCCSVSRPSSLSFFGAMIAPYTCGSVLQRVLNYVLQCLLQCVLQRVLQCLPPSCTFILRRDMSSERLCVYVCVCVCVYVCVCMCMYVLQCMQ